MIKRVAAIACCYFALVLIDLFIFIALSGTLPTFVTPESVPIAGVVLSSMMYFLVVTLLRRMRHIKEIEIALPLFWAVALGVPLAAMFVAFLVITADVSTFTALSTLAVMFGINFLAIYAFDAFSATYASKLRSELLARETNYELQRQEAAQKALQHYTDELEQQSTAVRKFRHDYQNILSSLDVFVEEDDWAGMKQYYTTKIKAASEVIIKNDFALEGLSKIKVKEIKSILAAKLMLAQSMGIDAAFEASDDIDHIPVDSVALVRMLGIILDNAIEELEALGEGKLLAGCFQMGSGVTFIVRNSCRPDLPKLRQLKQVGFSTKGEGRGLGLNNLSELAGSYPGVTLETSIAEGNFVQRLEIGEL